MSNFPVVSGVVERLVAKLAKEEWVVCESLVLVHHPLACGLLAHHAEHPLAEREGLQHHRVVTHALAVTGVDDPARAFEHHLKFTTMRGGEGQRLTRAGQSRTGTAC